MLELKDINMTFRSGLINHSVTKVLSDVNLNIERGKVFGLIGNSGSGKTTLAKIAVRLIDPTSGRIIIDGDDITMLNFSKMRAYRSRLQMVFQHPETAVNPEMKLGASLKEALVKSGVSRDRMKDTITETCNIMGISESILSRYPTQVSGGDRCLPGVVVLDDCLDHINHHAGAAPAQIGMKTEAADFSVSWYNVLGRDTLQSTVGGVARNSPVAKAVYKSV